jgi:retron-type reverse transcriptase
MKEGPSREEPVDAAKPFKIPKREPLGVPTVADRIAQEVSRRYLEPILEPAFLADSYGYRPGKSATLTLGRPSSGSACPRL